MSCPRCNCPYCQNERDRNPKPLRDLLKESKERVRKLADAQYQRQMKEYRSVMGQIRTSMAQ